MRTDPFHVSLPEARHAGRDHPSTVGSRNTHPTTATFTNHKTRVPLTANRRSVTRPKPRTDRHAVDPHEKSRLPRTLIAVLSLRPVTEV